jgi:hypothetical protein
MENVLLCFPLFPSPFLLGRKLLCAALLCSIPAGAIAAGDRSVRRAPRRVCGGTTPHHSVVVVCLGKRPGEPSSPSCFRPSLPPLLCSVSSPLRRTPGQARVTTMPSHPRRPLVQIGDSENPFRRQIASRSAAATPSPVVASVSVVLSCASPPSTPFINCRRPPTLVATLVVVKAAVGEIFSPTVAPSLCLGFHHRTVSSVCAARHGSSWICFCFALVLTTQNEHEPKTPARSCGNWTVWFGKSDGLVLSILTAVRDVVGTQRGSFFSGQAMSTQGVEAVGTRSNL